MKKVFLTLMALLVSQSVQAAATADVIVQIVPPVTQTVDVSAQYGIQVSNTGSANANSVVLTVELPVTATSPTRHVMGVLSGLDSRCTQSVNVLTCNLGQIRRNRNTTVTFTLATPYMWVSQDIAASATTTTSDRNSANNSDSHEQVLDFVPTDLAGTFDVLITSCYGQNLSSFYECELYPSSYSELDATFEETTPGNGVITFPTLPPEYAGLITGDWNQATDEDLAFTIYEANVAEVEFVGKAIGNDCFEGSATFPSSGDMIPYQVCVQ